MIEYGHFIGGKQVAGKSGRTADVFQPMDGTVRAHVALASKAEVRAAVENAEGCPACLGGGQSAAPRPRAHEVHRPHRQEQRRDGRDAGARARQDDRRRAWRHPARGRSGRIRARRAAPDERRIYRRRRPRHRPLFDAPAARRRRRHHAVQFSGDDPVVEARAGDRLRQRLHPEALGARPRRADAAWRIVRRGGRPSGHPQRRQRRQGGGRRHPRRSRHSGDRLRRLDPDRRIYLFARHGDRKARAVLRRRQEPSGGDARRGHGPDRRRPDRRGLRLGRRALHGGLGRGSGRQGDGGRIDEASHSARRVARRSDLRPIPAPTTARS